MELTKQNLIELADAIYHTLQEKRLVATGPDFTVIELAALLGVSRDTIDDHIYHGEYYHDSKRMFRREEILYRRSTGQDICKGNRYKTRAEKCKA
jgi:hypothetical protein